MKQYLAFLLTLLSVGACKKSQDFIRDNTTNTGVGYAPVCTNALSDVTAVPAVSLATSSGTAKPYASGAVFSTELQYFSQSTVKEINLYNTIGSGTRTLAGTWPYQQAYSSIKKLDTLLVPYTVPAAATGTIIKLEYDIVNQDALSLTPPRTVYIKLQ